MSWQPVLAGAARRRALAAVREIVAALPAPSAPELTDASLASGAAGLAVLCAYLSRAGLDDDENAASFLAQALAALTAAPMGPALYTGFTGIAWAAAHLQDQLLDADVPDPHAEIDRALRRHLARKPWRADYDLVNGLVGFGVYALERAARPSARALLQQVGARLAETAEHTPAGITWHTRPHLLPARQRAQLPRGYYNLGLAHGVPGVVALLGAACAAGVARAQARTLLDGAVSWLLSQQADEAAPSAYASWLGQDSESVYKLNPDGAAAPCRLAWCYGDAGVAAALFVAARACGEADWLRTALSLARRAARRSFETAGVRDAGLCHGAAGLGHVFNRLYQATGERELGAAARRWFARALALRRADERLAGFLTHRPDAAGTDVWVAGPGLLTGAGGVALALLAACTPVEPAWDRFLLLSAPPARI
ncbi:MAG TPA: lanthionine synthetase C family protein [Pyrinomonadaceae bacterium]|jgi:hypothetical protein